MSLDQEGKWLERPLGPPAEYSAGSASQCLLLHPNRLLYPQGCVTHVAPPLQVYLVHVDKEEDEQDQLCQEDDQQHDEKLERQVQTRMGSGQRQ